MIGSNLMQSTESKFIDEAGSDSGSTTASMFVKISFLIK